MSNRKRKPTRPGLNVQIRAARKAAKMFQSELADELGTSQQYIQLLESGKRMPSVRCLIAISAATGCEFPIDSETVMFTPPG